MMCMSSIQKKIDAMTEEQKNAGRAYDEQVKKNLAMQNEQKKTDDEIRAEIAPKYETLGRVWVRGERRRLYWNTDLLLGELADGTESKSERRRIANLLDGAYTDLVTGKHYVAYGNANSVSRDDVFDKMAELIAKI